jgi:hypothetical protein
MSDESSTAVADAGQKIMGPKKPQDKIILDCKNYFYIEFKFFYHEMIQVQRSKLYEYKSKRTVKFLLTDTIASFYF